MGAKRQIGPNRVRRCTSPLIIIQQGSTNIAVENRPLLLRLDVPPDTNEERNSCWLKKRSLHLLRRDPPLQQANKCLHAQLRVACGRRNKKHQTEKVRKGLLVRYIP